MWETAKLAISGRVWFFFLFLNGLLPFFYGHLLETSPNTFEAKALAPLEFRRNDLGRTMGVRQLETTTCEIRSTC
ncbi:unnamed protein product [Brassica oleracea var. botrytis]